MDHLLAGLALFGAAFLFLTLLDLLGELGLWLWNKWTFRKR